MIKSCYIHIPFCKTICSYCDFCKYLYNEKWISKYLESLSVEIENNYKQEVLKTVYVGGGTPSCLNKDDLNKLFNILNKLKLEENYEYTFECNIEDINNELLATLKENRVNRLSIGIETFNDTHLAFLGRTHKKEDIVNKLKLARKFDFVNISLDLMYAFTDQSLNDLDNDLSELLKLDVEHLSVYSLIISDNTLLKINKEKEIDQDLDYEMYKKIENKLEQYNYIHYEISSYTKKGYESLHNLTYWNNKEYYGFGAGASGYINNIRYNNSKNINKYLNKEFIKEEEILVTNEIIDNELILGLRKLKGINKKHFYETYNKNIGDIYDIISMKEKGLLEEDEDYIKIPKDKIYISNSILINFIRS